MKNGRIKTRGALRFKLSKVRTPPTEFLIFPYGRIDFTKGLEKNTCYFTKAGCKELLDAIGSRTADLEIDYEHDSANPDLPGPKPAAGFFNVEARADGLWAVNIHWSDRAKALLEAGEYRYFSPVFWTTKDTREIFALESMALTNNPAFDHLQALVAAKRDTTPTKGNGQMDFHKKLSAHMTKKAIAPKDAAAKLGCDENRLRKLMSGEEAPSQEEMEKCKSFEDWADEESQEHEASLDGANADTVHESPTDPDEDAPTKAAASRRDVELVSLTGTDDPVKQAGFLKALAMKAKAYDKDHADLVALKKDTMDRKRKELIEAGKRDGKLTPSLIKFYASRPVEELEAFLPVAPVVIQPGGEYKEPDPDAISSRLTAEQIECCRLTGVSEETLAKHIEESKSGVAKQKILATYRGAPAK